MSKKARLTIDMSQEEHAELKMAAARLGISMKELLLQAAFNKINTPQEPPPPPLPVNPWEEMKKRIME